METKNIVIEDLKGAMKALEERTTGMIPIQTVMHHSVARQTMEPWCFPFLQVMLQGIS